MIEFPYPISFDGRVGVLASMHQKETVMAPILLTEVGLQLQVASLNTDQFGTFTREIDRPGTQLEAARLKAKAAIDLTGHSLALASEGTFSPHPLLPYLACNRELVILIDAEHGLELVGETVSTQTNFRHQLVFDLNTALEFAQKAGFPDHGLVVMSDADRIQSETIVKGIHQEAELIEIVKRTLEQFGQAWLETDMRAMHNPTRMQVIGDATRDLVRKLKQRCPQCRYPGFDVVERQGGLPCEWCGSPTDLTLQAIYGCQYCGFQRSLLYPDGKTAADPAQCALCNP
ncbi:DUF6671 family protein [Thermocoleostomius sinensis]|jgi:hypothetical protein|uniref:DUF6671 domain-containing protein n=1 Tax=Thermocoleostomius sinensis A174 TaxID=2016057 RepID=A0A9E9C9U4_9CYAN|nr:DUF6671 family protein [Thermocoleostomius sinensis]WAL60062.1 hypothetical protein OXH18_23295 [Thermocoleostomius sinensis A174]